VLELCSASMWKVPCRRRTFKHLATFKIIVDVFQVMDRVKDEMYRLASLAVHDSEYDVWWQLANCWVSTSSVSNMLSCPSRHQHPAVVLFSVKCWLKAGTVRSRPVVLCMLRDSLHIWYLHNADSQLRRVMSSVLLLHKKLQLFNEKAYSPVLLTLRVLQTAECLLQHAYGSQRVECKWRERRICVPRLQPSH